MSTYKIYTDGAYSSKRNQGGIGIVILKDGKLIQEYFKGIINTTNNRMEILAVMIALNAIKEPIDNLIIYTDSMYVIGCATLGWKRKKNIFLWKKFDELFSNKLKLVKDGIEFVHVKGHEGDKWNERADTLAVAGSQEEIHTF